MSRLTVYSDDTERWRLFEADALLTLAKLPDACVDAIVTDPPYAISLRNETWDRFGGGELTAPEAFERWTARWAAECLRLLKPGGFMVAFGSPRTSHRLTAGVEDAGFEVRDQLLWLFAQGMPKSQKLPGGMGTALKPAYEPIMLARKPFDGTVADNLGEFGTGALNIDAARVGEARYWPANLAVSHAHGCDARSCVLNCPVGLLNHERENLSRLLFCGKATRTEREVGCEQLPLQSAQLYTGRNRPARLRRNIHPTVKPLALMRWLVRLITPPGGLVLDPFAGSGSTGAAAMLSGRSFLGIEREGQYVDIACTRLTHWAHQPKEPS